MSGTKSREKGAASNGRPYRDNQKCEAPSGPFGFWFLTPFPGRMRVVVLFALASGTVLDMALGRHKGKLTHEVSLFREMDGIIQENGVLLGDRAFAGWFDMARMIARGAHRVVRKHQKRKSDFRTGKRYGLDDHTIRLNKPKRPEGMSQEEYES